MATTLDPVSLKLVLGHANTWNLQAMVDAVAQDLSGKTMTAKVKHSGAGSPISLTLGSGLAFTAASQGRLSVSLTLAQSDAVPEATQASLYLTIWNDDNSIWGHGSGTLVATLG